MVPSAPDTPTGDLLTGTTPWTDAPPAAGDPLPERPVDVGIVGAGVMGAMVAERLTAAGLSVALVDARAPAGGSTAASTALVMWEPDLPLTHLARRIGEPAAVARWRRVAATVRRVDERIAAAGLHADRRDRPSLYLDGDLLDRDALRDEGDLRARHGLPSRFLAAGAVAERFAIAARPALVSDGSFEVDPVALTRGMLARARAAGATVTYPCRAGELTAGAERVTLATDRGPLAAGAIVLAGGYELGARLLPPAFALHTSFAIATAPGTPPPWREHAMIWEASESYLYARTDAAGRIVAGGADADYVDPERRARDLPAKAAQIADRLGTLTGARIEPAQRWGALFGASPDGLPAIGRARGQDRVWLASGFGGNGISFAALAAELLCAEFTGTPDPDLALFDPYRG